MISPSCSADPTYFSPPSASRTATPVRLFSPHAKSTPTKNTPPRCRISGPAQQETFSHVRKPESVQKTIYEMTEQNRRGMTAPAAPSAPMSVADELAKLDRLRDQGVISDQEFEAQKSRLLRQA